MKEIITEAELKSILVKRAQVEAFKKRAKDIEKELEPLEADILHSLKLGAKVTGRFSAFVNVVKGRASPSWKNEWEKLAKLVGRDPVAEEKVIKESYPAKTSEELEVKAPVDWEVTVA